MSAFREASFSERLGDAAKAKRAQLDKMRASARAGEPGLAERRAARSALNAARDIRLALRKTEKLASETREAEARARRKLADAEAEKLAQAARQREAVEGAAREIATLAEAKTARDARYAARKARRK